jgi:hypothetical protein
LEREGAGVLTVPCDVTDRSEVDALPHLLPYDCAKFAAVGTAGSANHAPTGAIGPMGSGRPQTRGSAAPAVNSLGR